MTLFPLTSSWWTGGNIPGKKAEPLTYIGGIDNYEKQCRATMDGWQGFEVGYAQRAEEAASNGQNGVVAAAVGPKAEVEKQKNKPHDVDDEVVVPQMYHEETRKAQEVSG